MVSLKFFIVVSVFYCTQSAVVEHYKTYKDYKVFNVESQDGLYDFIQDLKKHDVSLVYSGNRNLGQVLINPEILPAFEKFALLHGLKTGLVVDDYSKIIEAEKPGPHNSGKFSWTAYYDVDDIYGYLHNMSVQYPDSTELVEAGKSYEGRKILGLRINTPALGKAGKPVIFIESGIHAREWITPAATTYFINELLTNPDPAIKSMRDDFDWHIVPTCNPDGYHYSYTKDRLWRKTLSKNPNSECIGTDPNRNWDYNWMQDGTSDSPCAEDYGGTGVFSEIETRSLSEYLSRLKNLQAYIDFHSDAQVMLLPYSDSEKHFDNYDDLVKIGKTSLDYGYKVNHERYDGPATAAEILYPASGSSMDWVRHTLNVSIACAYELRGVNFEWPPERINEQGNEVTQMILGLVTKAKELGYLK